MKHKYVYIITVCCSILISFIFFYILYNADNKYNANYYSCTNGVLDLRNNDFNKNPVFQLAYDWEVYSDVHLTPEEIDDYVPNYNIFLGQYSGLDFGNRNHSYFGKATYHLKISLPHEVKCYTLEIPEIFSAYKLYINGRLLSECGNISESDYKAETKSSSVSFFAKDGIDIVVNVSNYNYFYGGMIYPPAFGNQEAVSKLFITRIVYRSMLVFISFTLGSLFFFVALKSNKIYYLFTLLCIFFIGYISYPIVHSFFICGLWIYKIEVLCYYGFITTILFIQNYICGFKEEHYNLESSTFNSHNIYVFFVKNIKKFIYIFSFAILIETLIPAEIICSNRTLIALHSIMRTLYKYCTFLFLTITTAIAAFKEIKHSRLLFIGFTIVATSFLTDRVFSLYEPIRFGWFYEHSGFILLCIIGYILAMTFVEFYSNSQKLSMQLDMQKNYYNVVRENIYSTRKLRHNINNHILVMKSFLKNHDTEKLWEYLNNYTSELPVFKQIVFCENQALNVLISYYYNIALEKQINIKIEKFQISADISKMEPDLCVLFGNLFTNAIEACEKVSGKERIIFINVHTQGNVMSIIFKNNFESSPVVVNDVFFSLKRIKQEGIGIPSIKNIVKKFDGQYKFKVKKDTSMFEVYLILIC